VFNNAQHDKQLLECLDWLELADTVDVDLQGIAANEQTTPADVRAQLIQIADNKVMQLIDLARADIMDDDNPMVSVTRKLSTRDNVTHVTVKRQIIGNKIEALGKLLKLTGGYLDERYIVESCY